MGFVGVPTCLEDGQLKSQRLALASVAALTVFTFLVLVVSLVSAQRLSVRVTTLERELWDASHGLLDLSRSLEGTDSRLRDVGGNLWLLDNDLSSHFADLKYRVELIEYALRQATLLR